MRACETAMDEGVTWEGIVGLAERVIRSAVSRHVSLACAESCTGGMIAAALTNVAGSSAVFLGGIVSYDPSVKHQVLGVPRRIIEDPRTGVVSDECACMMAAGAMRLCGARLSVSTTGIAGPTGAEPGKPVGTVYIGCSCLLPGGEEHTTAMRHAFGGDRSSVRLQATYLALETLHAALGELRA